MNIALCTLENGFRGISIRYLSSYLRSLGHSSEMLFLLREHPTFDNFSYFSDREVRSISQFFVDREIDIVGFSIMTGSFLQSTDLVRRLKNVLPNMKYVLGGVHATVCPGECLKAGADYVVVGDGEVPLKALLAGQDPSVVPGLGYTRNGAIIINPQNRRSLIALADLPFPDYDFSYSYFLDSGVVRQLNAAEYRERTAWGGKYYYLTTSRGCPYRCTYCCNMNRYEVRRNPVDRVVQELQHVREKLPFLCGINVQDDSFFMGSDDYLADFCYRVKNEFNWPFIARIMPKFVTDARIRLLKDGGLEHVSIGLQGSNRLNRKLYHRREDSRSFLNACNILHKYGINFVVDVILDNPYETEADLREIAEILNETPKPFTVLAYALTLFPGTELLEIAKQDGLDSQFSADAYMSMFRPTRPGAYSTPIGWRRLIETIIPQAPKSVVKAIIERGVVDHHSAKEINKLYNRYVFREKLGHKIKDFSPELFRVLLKAYRLLPRWNT